MNTNNIIEIDNTVTLDNTIENAIPVYDHAVMVLSREQSQERKERAEARNRANHIPAIEKEIPIQDRAREELFCGSQLGLSIAFAGLSKKRKELYQKYGRYQLRSIYDSGDMMWHMYLL